MTANVVMTDPEVVIIGAGPVGITVANILGLYGVRTLVLERELSFYSYPRVVGIDDEILRVFQYIGLIDQQLVDMLLDIKVEILSRAGQRLFITEHPKQKAYGYSKIGTVLQQLLEKSLRDGLTRFDCVEVRQGYTFEDATQSTDNVTITVRDLDGKLITITAPYLLGCDGGKSTVRKKMGINLIGSAKEDTWLVMDLIASEQLEPTIKIFGDSTRPAVQVPLPHKYQRWEFRLFPHDDHNQIVNDISIVNNWLSRWIDVKEIEIIRRRVYSQSSMMAERFQTGRVFLLGDAAHLMPPFTGQGLCSGIRDAANLSWKLASVLKQMASPKILQSYETERKPLVKDTINGSKITGRLFFPKDSLGEFVRDSLVKIINSIPATRRRLNPEALKAKPICNDGLFIKGSVSGNLIIQPQVRGEKLQLLDDYLGTGFAIIGLNIDAGESMNSETKAFWQKLQTRFITIRWQGQPLKSNGNCLELEDATGELKQWLSPYQIDILVLRPDRYIAIACKKLDLNQSTKAFQQLLS